MDRKGMTLSQHLRYSRLCGNDGGGHARDDDLAGLLTTLALTAKTHLSRSQRCRTR